MRAANIDRAAMMADYRAGMTIADLAVKYGCSEGYVHAVRRATGTPRRAPGSAFKRLSPSDKERVRRLYEAKEKIEYICSLVGISHRTLYRLVAASRNVGRGN